MRRPAVRFSLRWLLLASALIPAGLYWLALPTLHAQRYAAAINRGDYAVADKLCVDPSRPFPGDWPRHKTFEPKASLKPVTWHDLRTGRRELFVGIAYGDASGLASCGVEVSATRRGIEVGMFLP
ncbi:MAG TPA: hypothetical protein VFV87_09590 [Pirellulaceae bacterium]|nr:hypothetical protein [Pirellulaceae bacterium]